MFLSEMGNASSVWQRSLDCPSHFYLEDAEKIILGKSPPTYLREPTPQGVRNSLWGVGIMQGQAGEGTYWEYPMETITMVRL